MNSSKMLNAKPEKFPTRVKPAETNCGLGLKLDLALTLMGVGHDSELNR